MGKSNKKFLKKEKAKIKLKTSKTVLPKGQNLTDTNFKVKKIVIKDQIKPHCQGELLTTRKLNVQDLLSRLGHHNVNMRKEALEGLTELISNYSEEIIQSYLSVLLQNIARLVLDLIGQIRKEAVKLVAVILSKTQNQQLDPFFPSMSSYLICGLTHIDCAIREDSLYFLDILLKHTPKLCAKSASKLLPVLIDLVSQKNSINRTLSINLDSSTTSMKWRDKVLTRIRILLSTLVDSNDIRASDDKSTENELVIPNKRTFYPQFFNKAYTLSYLQLDCLSRVDETFLDFSLKSYFDTLIPLILDMFVEIVPQREENVGLSPDVCTILTFEDSKTLDNIVDILQLLWQIVENEENSKDKLNILSKVHGQGLISKLIKNKFPYVIRMQSNKKKKIISNLEEGKHDSSCRIQNLTLSKLVILFGNTSDWSYVIPYLKNCFRVADILNTNECEIFMSCISSICHKDNHEESKYFLNQVSKTAISSKSLLSHYCFTFLADIALDKKFKYYHGEKCFATWLDSLPIKLTKSKISASMLEKICQISIRNYKPFIESLEANIETILDNVPRINVEGMDKEKAQIKIANLLYFMKDWDQEMLEALNEAVKKEYWGSLVTSYIKDILRLKTEWVAESSDKEEEFVN